MQLWLVIVVFHNSSICYESYFSASSQENKDSCFLSLNQMNQNLGAQCQCMFVHSRSSTNMPCSGNNKCLIDQWDRVFDTLSSVIASFIIISLTVIESYRSFIMIDKIMGSNCVNKVLTSFEYNSLFGFLAMVLDPGCFKQDIKSHRKEILLIIIDCMAIGLVFRYCYILNVRTESPFIINILLSCTCNSLGHMANMHVLNYKKLKSQSVVTINDQPIIHIVPSVPEPIPVPKSVPEPIPKSVPEPVPVPKSVHVPVEQESNKNSISKSCNFWSVIGNVWSMFGYLQSTQPPPYS